jgi:hypothetical protein
MDRRTFNKMLGLGALGSMEGGYPDFEPSKARRREPRLAHRNGTRPIVVF